MHIVSGRFFPRSRMCGGVNRMGFSFLSGLFRNILFKEKKM